MKTQKEEETAEYSIKRDIRQNPGKGAMLNSRWS
jgi:hypothetical protein